MAPHPQISNKDRWYCQGISAAAAKCVLITFLLSVIGPVVLAAVIRLF